MVRQSSVSVLLVLPARNMVLLVGGIGGSRRGASITWALVGVRCCDIMVILLVLFI